MQKTVDDVLRNHITIYDDLMENKKKYIEQIDYLAFYVNEEARKTKNPYTEYMYGERDNTNYIKTKRDNVYADIDEKQTLWLTYVEWWHAPVKILRRKQYKNQWRIDIYWKWLKLYYSGKITRLEDYVRTYQGETQRVDICRDSKTKYSEFVCDIGYKPDGTAKWKHVVVEQNNERTYRTYGNKNSALFVRIYDKTLDLKDGKFIHAWLYPERYKKECWRLEAKLTLEYARADTPINWLKMVKRDKVIETKENPARNLYKTALLSLISIIEYNIPNYNEQLYTLQKAQERIKNKIKQIQEKTFNNNEFIEWKTTI